MDTVSGAGIRHPALADIAAILFDKDGTLLDFEATWGPATTEVLTELSGGDQERFRHLASSCGFLVETERFLPDSPIIGGYTDDFAPAWAALLDEPYDDAFKARIDGLFRAASLAHLSAYDDVAPSLARLRDAAFPIGLATNDAEATAKAHLRKLGLENYFSFITGYDSGYGAKPGGGMVQAFAQASELRTDQIALVGDSPHDIYAANAAGAVGIGIARTKLATGNLEGLPATMIETLGDLLTLLGLES